MPPLLKDVFDQYKDVLGLPADSSAQDLLKGPAGKPDLNKIDANKLPENIKAMIR